MTETESKIVQLLKSDEDCNKILGLMLGRNELGVERLLVLVERYSTSKNSCCLLTLKISMDEYKYSKFDNLKPKYKAFKNNNYSTEFDNNCDCKVELFNQFLKLTIDDNI